MANYNLTQTGDEVQAYIDSIPVIDVTGTLNGSAITFGSNPYSQIAANYAADCSSIIRLTVGTAVYLLRVTQYDGTNYTVAEMSGAHKVVATIGSSAASATIDAGIDATPTQGSDNLITSGGVWNELKPIKEEVFGVSIETIDVANCTMYQNRYVAKNNLKMAVSSSRLIVLTEGWQQGDTIIVEKIETASTLSAAICTSNELLQVGGGGTEVGIENLLTGTNAYATGVPLEFTPNYEFQYVYFSLKALTSYTTLIVKRKRASGSISEKVAELQIQVDTNEEQIATIYNSASVVNEQAIVRDTYMPRYIDMMTTTSNGTMPNIKKLYTPVSKTSTSLTLSDSDSNALTLSNPRNDETFANITSYVTISAKMSGGNYYNVVMFRNGAVLEKYYDFGMSLDLTDVENFMFLQYDSLHLSPYGYRAWAHELYRQLQTKYINKDRFHCGFTTDNATTDSDKNILVNGAIVGECVENTLLYTGNTGVSGISNGGGISVNPARGKIGGSWTFKNLYIQQGTAGVKIKWKFAFPYPIKGFVSIGGCCPWNDGAFWGTALLEVSALDGSTIYSANLPKWVDNIYVDIDDKYYNGIYVSITINENASTLVNINSILVYSTHNAEGLAFDALSNVAILGSSNTQKPDLSVAQQLLPSDVDNSIVVMPDGTNGDGCAYYPKELARLLSSATFGNWGKSGAKTDYGFEKLDTIFGFKKYSHIILSLFANDLTSGRSVSVTKARVRRLVEYAKSQGCIPIVIQSYGMNGNPTTTYSPFNQTMMKGLDW